MDLRFGRAPYFLITDGTETHFISNPYDKEENNVGPRVVDFLKKHHVSKLITGEVGPKASTRLTEEKIQIIMLSEDKVSLQHVLKKMFPNQ